MDGKSKAVIEMLETFGGSMTQSRADYPVCANQASREEGRATDAEVVNRAQGPKPTMKAYQSGKHIGGMGGDMAFPFRMGQFGTVESDSTGPFTARRALREGAGRSGKGSKKTVESDAADDPMGGY